MAMHKMQQHQLPLVLLGAGLPILPGMAGESKSYAERLFSFPIIGALSQENSAKALQEPALDAGVPVEFRIADIDHGFLFPLRYFEVHYLAPDRAGAFLAV